MQNVAVLGAKHIFDALLAKDRRFTRVFTKTWGCAKLAYCNLNQNNCYIMFRASLMLDAASRLPRELELHMHAAVYGDYLSRYVGGFVACKECYCFSDVLRGSHTF